MDYLIFFSNHLLKVISQCVETIVGGVHHFLFANYETTHTAFVRSGTLFLLMLGKFNSGDFLHAIYAWNWEVGTYCEMGLYFFSYAFCFAIFVRYTFD